MTNKLEKAFNMTLKEWLGDYFWDSIGCIGDWQHVDRVIEDWGEGKRDLDTELIGGLLKKREEQLISNLANLGFTQGVATNGYELVFPVNGLEANAVVRGEKMTGVVCRTPKNDRERKMYRGLDFPHGSGIDDEEAQRILDYRKFILIGCQDFMLRQIVQIAYSPLELIKQEQNSDWGQKGFVFRVDSRALKSRLDKALGKIEKMKKGYGEAVGNYERRLEHSGRCYTALEDHCNSLGF